jgi:hypothetical protein
VAKELFGIAVRISGPSIRHEFPFVKLRKGLPLAMISREFQLTYFMSPAVKTTISPPRQAERSY